MTKDILMNNNNTDTFLTSTPRPPFSAPTPTLAPGLAPVNLVSPSHLHQSMGANPANFFGMVRLASSPPDHHFLMHQARINVAAAAQMNSNLAKKSPMTPPNTNSRNSSSSSLTTSSSSTDKSLNSSSSGSETPMSRTNQYKKIMKPLLERKRRARINKCLDELKDIMTVALQAQGENVSKLEKADILELTVRHLHKLQQNQRLMPRNPIEDIHRFQAGYSSCAQEAATYLLQSPGVDVKVSQRLLNHLSSSSAITLATQNHFQINPSNSPQSSAGDSLSPHPSQNGFHSPPGTLRRSDSPRLSPPPRPLSNPETKTLGTFTLAITKACNSDLEEEEEDSSRAKMPLKPEPIRLNPNDPVWRPF